MPERAEQILAIVDGSVESLITCMLINRPDRARAWFVGGGAEDSELRRTAVELQVELLGMQGIDEPNAEAWATLSGGFGESAMLLAAVATAAEAGRAGVVWPKHAPDDLGTMMDASDRALLVQRLGLIESARHDRLDVRIDTPILDLSRRQLAELAVDLDAPVWSVWWAAPEAADSRTAQRERAEWASSLDAAGGSDLLDRPRAAAADA